MAKNENQNKRVGKQNQKAVKKGFFARLAQAGKSLKTFFINLRAELKRVVWPDRKRLIQNTATVLAICLIASVILFVVDSVFGGILEGIGFYSPKTETAAPPAIETTIDETSQETEPVVSDDTDE